MFKLKHLLPLVAVAGVLFILPACGKKGNNKKASTQRRDYRRKSDKKSRNDKKSRRRRSFLFRK